MKRSIRLIMAIILLLTLGASLCGCAKKDPYADIPAPIATITLKDGREMRFILDLTNAPNTVANFVELANKGYYDGMTFYRIMPGVMIQAGDRSGTGTGGAGYYIQGEFKSNGIENNLTHKPGTISMARRDNDKDSASSQFFIMQGNYPEYDGQYAAFGYALDDSTIDVIDSIAMTPVDGSYHPYGDNTPTIQTIRVNTHGYEYEAAKIEIKD